jgi:signal transduction histidine kinase
MKRLRVLGLVFAIFAFGAASAADRGTADEATAMVRNAIAYIKKAGKEKAFAEFANPANKDFHNRDLYIFVYDMSGTNVSHGINPKMVGKNLLEMRDYDGKYIVKGFIEVASTKGKGWFDYKWPNPLSQSVESKSAYVEKVDNLIVGAGIYK